MALARLDELKGILAEQHGIVLPEKKAKFIRDTEYKEVLQLEEFVSILEQVLGTQSSKSVNSVTTISDDQNDQVSTPSDAELIANYNAKREAEAAKPKSNRRSNKGNK